MNYMEPKTLESDLKKITREAGITFIGFLCATGLKYICTVVIARHVGAPGFGAYVLGLTILSLAEILAVAGLHYGILRYVSMYTSDEKKEEIRGIIVSALKCVLLISIFVGLLLFMGADLIAREIFSKIELARIIRWLSLSIPFLAVIEISVFSTQAVQTLKYKVYVKDVFQHFFNLGIVIVFFMVGLKVMGAVYAYIFSAIVSCLLGLYYLRKLFPDITNWKMKGASEFTSLLRFSIPVLGMRLLGFGMMWTDILMLGYFVAARDVGIYSAAARTAILIHIILFSFSAIFMPMISDLYHRGEIDKLMGLFKTVTRWIFTLSFPMFLVMAILSKHIMTLFGSEFMVGFPCFLILALVQIINSSAGPVGNVLVMSGKQDIVFFNTALSCTLNIILNYVLIARYGIVGAAIATGFSIIVINGIFLIEVYHYYGIHPYSRKILKPFLAGLTASLASLGLYSVVKTHNSGYVFPLIIGLFVCCYVVFLYVSGFDDEDKVISHAILEKFSSLVKGT